MNATTLAAVKANAMMPGTAANALASACQDAITNPKNYTTRGGADGNTWPRAALVCSFGYLVTGNSQFLTQALKYLTASLEDDQTLGDKLGCVANASPNWQSWNGTSAAPPVILTVTHDTGYPMRWYGPYIALAYDWLSGTSGFPEALRTQTRFCLQNWVDYYTKKGYHQDEAGTNYNAGYVAGKTFAAIALGTDAGADGDRLWNETVTTVFQGLLIGKGMSGMDTSVGSKSGPLLGGDWSEGWQYGPLSVYEYAMAARAMEENGLALPELDAWTNSLALRYIYGTVPHLDGHLAGGDFEDESRIYAQPNRSVLAAVLAGPSSDMAASWAKAMQKAQGLEKPGSAPYFADVLAELRAVDAKPYAEQTPAPALWYLARGTRALYVRSAWDTNAFWGVFTAAPQVTQDHHHFDASDFVFSRGGDHLIVDLSGYGCRSTLPTNALTADSGVVQGKYAPSQTPWSAAELLWARGTDTGVFAARGDIAKAFNFSGTPSDIPYAHREWVFLPEGEIVTIDRVRTGNPARGMYVSFHTNTAGTLKVDTATGTVGGTVGTSKVVIHPVTLSGATPVLVKPPVGGECYDGTCTNIRMSADNYTVKVPGPWAVAIHAIDGLGSDEAPAVVASLNDPVYDPGKMNDGIIGAAVFRSTKQSFVVASSAQDGKAPDMMTYQVPGASSGRHIVFDAPEAPDGQAQVTATVAGDHCAVTIAPGAGFAGRPLMFQVTSVADGCKATEDTNVSAGTPPPGGGVLPIGNGTGNGPGGGNSGGGNGGAGGDSTPGGGNGNPGETTALTGGCGCVLAKTSSSSLSLGGALAGVMIALAASRRRKRR
ncbi:MAG TPA: hypothetical protein VNO55_27525 [Polyangia bacterium]|nr:hypothetical protein [Polyangia bacterium]